MTENWCGSCLPVLGLFPCRAKASESHQLLADAGTPFSHMKNANRTERRVELNDRRVGSSGKGSRPSERGLVLYGNKLALQQNSKQPGVFGLFEESRPGSCGLALESTTLGRGDAGAQLEGGGGHTLTGALKLLLRLCCVFFEVARFVCLFVCLTGD